MTGKQVGMPPRRLGVGSDDQIRAKVRGNIVVPPGVQGNPEAVFIVDQLPDGTVVSAMADNRTSLPETGARMRIGWRAADALALPTEAA